MKYLILKKYKSVPTDLNARQMLEVQLEEMKYLARLRDEGRIEQVWKVPAGSGQSVLLIDAETHEEIDEMINQMPDFPHFIFDIRVIPLSSLAAVEETMRKHLEARQASGSPRSVN